MDRVELSTRLQQSINAMKDEGYKFVSLKLPEGNTIFMDGFEFHKDGQHVTFYRKGNTVGHFRLDWLGVTEKEASQ